METEDRVVLTPEQKAEIFALEQMFLSDGWSIFLREQTKLLDSLIRGAVDNAKTVEDLWLLKGAVTYTRQIVGYEASIEAQKAYWDSEHEPNTI